MSIIFIDPDAYQEIKAILVERRLPLSVRIEIRSTGCCDASLAIAAGDAEPDDIMEEMDGLQVRVAPSIHELVGNISVSYITDSDQQGFMISSEKPLNEWVGFATSCIRL